MTKCIVHTPNFSKELLLIVAGLMFAITPAMFGQENTGQSQAGSPTKNVAAAAPKYEYEVASIKPNKSTGNMRRMGPPVLTPDDGLAVTNLPLQAIVQMAYGVFNEDRLVGAPSWLRSERYDIQAKMDSSVADELKKLSAEDRKLARQQMLQALLAERFKLVVRHESKEHPIYTLLVDKNGSKLQESKLSDSDAAEAKGAFPIPGGGSIQMAPGGAGGRGGSLTVRGVSIDSLIPFVSMGVGRPVVDKTGLKGRYDFTLTLMPDEAANAGPVGIQPPPGGPEQGGSKGGADMAPILIAAIHDQLGLKLESGKGPVEIIIIEHIERPSEN